METQAMTLAAIIGPIMLVLGLSVLLYAKQWHKLINEWKSNHFMFIFGGMMAMVIGLIMINMYNVWEWHIYLIITLFGWAGLVKGAFYFLAPGSIIKGIINMFNNTALLYVTGLIYLVIGGIFTYGAYYMPILGM